MRELTAAGLSVNTLTEIRDFLADTIRSKLGEEAQVHAYSVLGQLIDAYAEEQVEIDDLLLELYAQLDPDTATGVFLEAHLKRAGLEGLKPATSSQVELTISGVTGTNIPAGTRYRVDNGPVFATDDSADVGAGGDVDVWATCTETGPITALAGTVTEIVDVITDITGVTNVADAVPGTNQETESAARARRRRSLSIAGQGPWYAIRAALNAIPGVQHATVIDNTELETDSLGIPGKAYRSIVWPDTVDPETVAQAIFDETPGGIRIDGAESYTIIDGEGREQVMRWSWATPVDAYVEVNILKGTDYGATGDDAAVDNVLAYFNSLLPGDWVKPDAIRAVLLVGGAALGIDVPRVLGVRHMEVFVRLGAPPAGDPAYTVPAEVGPQQIAIGDSTRITIGSL